MPDSVNLSGGIDTNHIELSDQYYKSRKQLMLYSGLFFIYELIGVRVPKQPIPNSKIEFLSPKAVPYVLLLLVIYFFYRTMLGWLQSNPSVRLEKVSKWDLYPSISVPILSVWLHILSKK